jgi:hypothetical protein
MIQYHQQRGYGLKAWTLTLSATRLNLVQTAPMASGWKNTNTAISRRQVQQQYKPRHYIDRMAPLFPIARSTTTKNTRLYHL